MLLKAESSQGRAVDFAVRLALGRGNFEKAISLVRSEGASIETLKKMIDYLPDDLGPLGFLELASEIIQD